MEKKENTESFYNQNRQKILYFSFAILMIVSNILIQEIHKLYISGFIIDLIGTWSLVQKYYVPPNMTELVGSILAVGITYIVKFLLDKFVVFKNKGIEIKQVSREFSLYFIISILTTLENISIQFLMSNYVTDILWISIVTALTIGYITRFFIDRKYVFNKNVDCNEDLEEV